jgi:ArsR family transcriptional regulator
MSSPLDDMDRLFKAVADATRLRILGLLLTGELCVCDIQQALKIPQPKVSRHLAYLRRAGLVETRREGLWIYYRLVPPSNPVVAAVGDSVRHALTHVDSVRHDAERLQKKTGRGLPTPADVPAAACCANRHLTPA